MFYIGGGVSLGFGLGFFFPSAPDEQKHHKTGGGDCSLEGKRADFVTNPLKYAGLAGLM